MKLILICSLALLATSQLTGKDLLTSLTNDGDGWTSYATIETQGLGLERGEFLSLTENKQTFKHTAISDTFLTWFDQYFDFTAGTFYQVDGTGCTAFNFPPLNITAVLEEMFQGVIHMGGRGPHIELFFMDMKLDNKSTFFYVDAKRHRVDKAQSWDLTQNVPITA